MTAIDAGVGKGTELADVSAKGTGAGVAVVVVVGGGRVNAASSHYLAL